MSGISIGGGTRGVNNVNGNLVLNPSGGTPPVNSTPYTVIDGPIVLGQIDVDGSAPPDWALYTSNADGGNTLYYNGGVVYYSGNIVPIASGGTGAVDASTARLNLGMGSMATQGADDVTITGGSITGVTYQFLRTDMANSGNPPNGFTQLNTSSAGRTATFLAGTEGELRVIGNIGSASWTLAGSGCTVEGNATFAAGARGIWAYDLARNVWRQISRTTSTS